MAQDYWRFKRMAEKKVYSGEEALEDLRGYSAGRIADKT